MKRVWGIGIVAGLLLVGARPASATPAIDGLVGVGEWAGALFVGFDGNEAFQGDAWDISAFYVFQETSGGGLGNGLYFRMDTFDAPTFAGEPPGVSDESRFVAFLDFDGDSAIDRIVQFNDTNDDSVNIYDGSLTFLGTGSGLLGSTVEWFAPAALLPGSLTINSQVFGTLDNGGLLAEDFVPDQGFLTPIPEPTSSLLFGFGLLGAAGLRRIRRRK